ncbi:MAG: hypothetical protein QNJ46_32155 [Leptolyngbyaceae cyanobacterium MO_188.B28]|nr:hypothetical protein [Leptolyngbyaceae cyanobacterium MO_188.B28]
MTPKSPQHEVSIVVGKKRKSRKLLPWVGLATLGSVLTWGAIHAPFNIKNGLTWINQIHPTQPTELKTTDGSTAPQTVKLGVPAATIQALFEQPDIGFTFESASPIQGNPRLMGQSPHGLAVVELIGQPENLTTAIIRISIPDDDIQALALNAEYVLRFIQTMAPQWAEGGNWVIQNLDAFATGQRSEVNTIHAGKEISMTLTGKQEFLTITVKAVQ